MEKQKFNKGEIAIYKSPSGPEIQVKLKEDTVWLDAHLIAKIFDVNRPAIVKHINNIYKTCELDKKTTCSILEQVAADGKIRKMNLYNLDTIISVGYRVNSKRATQFRIWATKTLKEHLIKGYTINEKRLLETREKFKELQFAISFLQEKSKKKLLTGQEGEILSLLFSYAKTLTLLEGYDKGKLEIAKGKKAKFVLSYDECKKIIGKIKEELMIKKQASNFFGNEAGRGFEGIVGNLYQTFGGKELYKTIEEKVAHLLYFTIKDHYFTDGNKRIASFLFVYFLDKNDYLYCKNGEKKINDNALVALALLIAESDPKEKDILIKIIISLISD
ncbi:virulence RhuM family protein [Patescibacteria group bacterium]|nr:virulence RhuM family protein [Patescibacteria group bacterium]